MRQRLLRGLGFILGSMITMIILHGNSRQFWPKIPYLSLRDESISEHTRLLFNTLTIVSLAQLALGALPRARWGIRTALVAGISAALPGLILFGQKVLRLEGRQAEIYNLSMVPLLPIAAVITEEVLTAGQA
jgi:hypothetical protein